MSKHKLITYSSIIVLAIILAVSLFLIRNNGSLISRSSDRPTKQNNRYGAHTYNTPQVVREMEWINSHVKKDQRFRHQTVFITGSTAGIGEVTANYLVHRGFQVVAHARDQKRARDVRRDIPGLKAVLIGDFNDLDQTRRLAKRLNSFGRFDLIIHNAGVYGRPSKEMLNVNVLSPFILTALVQKPRQLIYTSSDLSSSGSIDTNDLLSNDPSTSYNDTKLYLLTISNYLAHRWSDVRVNAITPGWVPTKMGFADGNKTTPDNMKTGYMTQVALAENRIKRTGSFLYKQRPFNDENPLSQNEQRQTQLINALEHKTGARLPN